MFPSQPGVTAAPPPAPSPAPAPAPAQPGAPAPAPAPAAAPPAPPAPAPVPYSRFAEVNRQLQAERSRNEQLLGEFARLQQQQPPAPASYSPPLPRPQLPYPPQPYQPVQMPGQYAAPRQFQLPGVEQLDPDLQVTAAAVIGAMAPQMQALQQAVTDQNRMMQQMYRHSVKTSAQETLGQLGEQYSVFKHPTLAAHAQKLLGDKMALQELVQPALRRSVPELANEVQTQLEEIVGGVETHITDGAYAAVPPQGAGASVLPGGTVPPVVQTHVPADFRQATAQMKATVNAARAAAAGQRQ